VPCYQVNMVSLDFQAGDRELLTKAARVLGLELRGNDVVQKNGIVLATLKRDKAECLPEHVALVNKLRVQYSREIVNHACLKLGWQKVVKSDNKIQLKKGM